MARVTKRKPVSATRKTAARKGAPRKARAHRRRSLLWRLLRWPVKVCAWAVIFCVLWVGLYRFVAPPGGIYLASEAWRLGGVSQDWVAIDEISPHLLRSAMAAEDARFCDHYGFDFDAIQDALEARAEGRRLRGGSTISQQVAKNMFLWHERSWIRKGLEAGFTVLIEAFWPKRRILEVYLNMAEFGEGVFGAQAAAQHHFGRSAAALTSTQAARLASVLPNPKERSASRPSAFVRKRARSVRAGAQTLERQGRDRCAF
ncbi:MAG: monofunctional biosynthetic peptidoglycan transglycosylase [Pseudomonadota bacterium]